MADKNLKQKNSLGKTADINERIGLIVLVVSVFILFCLITRALILGVVGEFVYKIGTGVLGCFAYPLFFFTLIWAIAKMRNRTFSIKRRYVVLIFAVLFFTVQILQIITTNEFISQLSYGSYLSSIYNSDLTAGGLLASVVAYPLARFLTPIGAYLLLGIAILISFILATIPYKSKEDKKVVKEKRTIEIVAESSGLFVESLKVKNDSPIINADDYVGEEGQEEIPNEYSVIDSFHKNQTDEYWEKLIARRNAIKTLFTENDKAFEKFNLNPDGTEIRYKRKPLPEPKIVATQDTSLQTYEKPPIILGDIINGDLESKKIAEQNGINTSGTVQPVNVNENNLERIKAGVNSVSSVFETDIPVAENINKGFDFSSLPPIINGDRFEDKEEVAVSEPYKYNPEVLKPKKEEIVVAPAPIINADTYKSATEYETAKPTYNFNDAPAIQIKEEDRAPIIMTDDVVEEKNYYNEESNQPVMTEEECDSCDDYTEILDENDVAKISNPSGLIVGDTYNIQDNPLNDYGADDDDDDDETELIIEADEDVDDEDEDDELFSTENSLSDIEEPTEEEVMSGALVFDGNETIEPKENPLSYSQAVENDEDFTAHLSDEELETKKREEEFRKNTSFNIIDEVEDLTENSNQTSQAINDYYSEMISTPDDEPVGINSHISPILSQRNKTTPPIKGQISLNDYAPEVMEEKKPKKVLRPYTFPKIDMLTCASTPLVVDDEETNEKIELLEYCLETTIGIPAKVIGVKRGPAVTRYELDVPTGTRVNKIETAANDIKYNLACKHDIRIQTPIPGKRAVGVEVPNDTIAMVGLKDIIDSEEFKNSSSPLTLALGKDIEGNIITTRLDKLPHLLIAGTTGSGKSACLNSLIISLIYKSSPEDVKLILVDPKCVEFVSYSGLPHMLIPNPITDVNQAIKAFSWVRDEMNRRYKVLQEHRFRNIEEYNNSAKVKNKEIDKLPFIVFIVDEYAELMCSTGGSDKKKVLETHIQSLTQKARAAGIHLILATQRPSRDVVTGTIKSNLPGKIAFKVANGVNSQVILDKLGAEALVGRGDMLFQDPTSPEPIRVQGAYVENDEVQNIVEYIINNNDTDFSSEFENSISEPEVEEIDEESEENDTNFGDYDKDIEAVARAVLKSNNASGSMIQRKFGMGYIRAVKIVDQLEELGCVGPLTASNKREVLITNEKFKELFGKYPDE